MKTEAFLKLKPGNRVRVKVGLEEDFVYDGYLFITSMRTLKGKNFLIRSTHFDDENSLRPYIKFYGCSYLFTPSMIETTFKFGR